MKKAGIDILSVANNHAMDMGAGGLRKTLDNIEASGVIFIGAGRTAQEASQLRFLKARGMTVAFLSYTYDTNEGMPRKSRTNRQSSSALRGAGIILRIVAEKRGSRARLVRAEFMPVWTLREAGRDGILYRPVSIDREISRLKSETGRTPAEESMLNLLNTVMT